jgi:hypothetical protein
VTRERPRTVIETERIDVAPLHPREPNLRHQLDELGHVIGAVRRGDQSSTGRENASELRQRRVRIRDVVQHMVRDQHVRGRAAERQRHRVRTREGEAAVAQRVQRFAHHAR